MIESDSSMTTRDSPPGAEWQHPSRTRIAAIHGLTALQPDDDHSDSDGLPRCGLQRFSVWMFSTPVATPARVIAPPRARMTGDVRKRLLHDPVGRRLDLGWKAPFEPDVFEFDRDSGLVLLTFEEPE
jgi:hypothetical protein